MPLTLAQQSEIVSELAAEALTPIWLLSSAQDVLEALLDTLPGVIDTWGGAAATLAADWYDDQRESSEIKGRFTPVIPDMGDTGAEELAHWGVGPMFAIKPDIVTTQSNIEGGLQRRIANHSRQTVMNAAVADKRALGWQRITSGDSCAFCAMLASRGAIYTSKTADFAAHDRCNCSVSVAFKNRKLPVSPYTPSSRRISDVDRARVRDWLKANPQ